MVIAGCVSARPPEEEEHRGADREHGVGDGDSPERVEHLPHQLLALARGLAAGRARDPLAELLHAPQDQQGQRGETGCARAADRRDRHVRGVLRADGLRAHGLVHPGERGGRRRPHRGGRRAQGADLALARHRREVGTAMTTDCASRVQRRDDLIHAGA